MKQTEIKTKKLEIVIFNNGYICIDGHYIVKADAVTLDNDLLQDKISKNMPFYYHVSTKTFGNTIPQLIDIVPAFNDDMDRLQNTYLFTNHNKAKISVFYNADKKYFVYINKDFVELLQKIDTHYSLYQNSRFSGVACYQSLKDVLFYAMPITIKDCFLNIFEGVEV